MFNFKYNSYLSCIQAIVHHLPTVSPSWCGSKWIHCPNLLSISKWHRWTQSTYIFQWHAVNLFTSIKIKPIWSTEFSSNWRYIWNAVVVARLNNPHDSLKPSNDLQYTRREQTVFGLYLLWWRFWTGLRANQNK